VRHKMGPMSMGDLVEPANLGVEVTTQQEEGGHLGGVHQLVHQSMEGVSNLDKHGNGPALGLDTSVAKHGIVSEAKRDSLLQQTHTHGNLCKTSCKVRVSTCKVRVDT